MATPHNAYIPAWSAESVVGSNATAQCMHPCTTTVEAARGRGAARVDEQGGSERATEGGSPAPKGHWVGKRGILRGWLRVARQVTREQQTRRRRQLRRRPLRRRERQWQTVGGRRRMCCQRRCCQRRCGWECASSPLSSCLFHQRRRSFCNFSSLASSSRLAARARV